jgi:hypothetical protein
MGGTRVNLPQPSRNSVSWVLGCALTAVAALGCSGPSDPICKGDECGTRFIPVPDAGMPLLTADDSGAPRLTEAEAACAMLTTAGEPGKKRPVDIIFVIDNSGSMSEEIAAVRRNIDHDFAAIIDESDLQIDYRVLMLSQFGETGTGVCIDPPLAGADCSQGLAKTNSDRYFQLDLLIGSNDPLCQILDALDNPSLDKRAPKGLETWLRPEASKAFVLITDDSARCRYTDAEMDVIIGADGFDPFEDALKFHAALKAKSPEHFGGHYQFFSIVGMAVHGDQPQAVFPSEPIENTTCSTAPTPGQVYQALSVATDALRYPVCEGRSFDALFQALAQSVIQTASAECTYQLPEVREPQVLDLPSVNLEVRRSPDMDPQHFDQVEGASACKDAHSFYIHDRIELCPEACQLLQRSPDPSVQILYGCTVTPE